MDSPYCSCKLTRVRQLIYPDNAEMMGEKGITDGVLASRLIASPSPWLIVASSPYLIILSFDRIIVSFDRIIVSFNRIIFSFDRIIFSLVDRIILSLSHHPLL